VVPPELRPILGKETISATLGSTVLDHDTLQRWIEIDRDAEQRLNDARHQLAGQKGPANGTSTVPAFVDIRRCLAAFTVWKEREIGRESVRLYSSPELLTNDAALARFEEPRRKIREKLTAPDGYKVLPCFDEKLSEALLTAGVSLPAGHVVMNVLRPTFRDVWGEVLRVVDGIVEAIGQKPDQRIDCKMLM
jgi:hypothetical protein